MQIKASRPNGTNTNEMNTPQLRPYQQDLIDRILQQLQTYRSVMGQLPTGGGKSVVFGAITAHYASLGLRVLLIAHREELIIQGAKHLANWTQHPVGIIKAGYPFEPLFPIQFASIQTIVNRLDRLTDFDIVIIDETHHATSNSYTQVLDRFPDAKILGLTATPVRTDGKGFEGVFDVLECGICTADLIEAGYLSPYRLFAAPNGLITKGARTKMGDYSISDLEDLNDADVVAGDVVKSYQEHANGATCIAFALSVKHSICIADAYNKAGIPAQHIDAQTDSLIRKEALEKLKTAELKIISNVGLFGEGVDVPTLDCVQIVRPTKSLGLHLQMLGRVLRVAEGKQYGLILDHAGNCQRLGLPDSIRGWGLDGKPQRAVMIESEDDDDKVIKVREENTAFVPEIELLEVDSAAIIRREKALIEKLESQAPGWGRRYLEIVNQQRFRSWKKYSIVYQLIDKQAPLVVWQAAAEYLGYKSGWGYYKWQESQAKAA